MATPDPIHAHPTAQSTQRLYGAAPANDARPVGNPISRLKPNLFICGPSGSGKSRSMKHLCPERTIILSTEQKALPFKGAMRFTKHMMVEDLAQFQRLYTRALDSVDADTLVIDSWTSLTEFTYNALVRDVERKGDASFEAWKQYRDCLHEVLLRSKNANKQVIFLGTDKLIQDDQQRLIRTIGVQGSLEGNVEKEFTVVLWTKVLPFDPSNPNASRYVFVTNSDGMHKAKSPEDMFAMHFPNDLHAVLDRFRTFELEDV